MRLAKLINYKVILALVFVAAFYLTRFPGLYNDSVNPDSVNWHFRSEQFMNGLKFFQLEKTYQHYQPGVSLMWIMGPSVELVKQLYPGHEIYSTETFPAFHFFSRIILIHVQLALTVWTFFLLKKFIDWRVAALAVTLFTFEPFFAGNSRELHMDILLSLSLILGLVFSFWCLKEFNWKRCALAGFFLGMSFLTKSVGIGGMLYTVAAGCIWRKNSKYGLLILVASLLTVFVFLPALWKEPAYVLGQIYEGVTKGIEDGHNEIVFGKETRDAGLIFYPLILVLKTTPIFLAGLVLYVAKLKLPKFRLPEFTLISFLAIFYIGYFVVMSIGSKKIDRYILPMYPFLAILVAHGFYSARGLFEKVWAKIAATLAVGIFLIWPFISLRPFYFTYTNQLFGSSKFVHEKILAQKPFGLGVFALRDYLLKNFGPEANIAFYDPKPFFWLWDRDRVKFVEIDGTRDYEILVLGVNEKMPEKVLQSAFEFNYFGSLHINGLEYWKVYVRGDQKKY